MTKREIWRRLYDRNTKLLQWLRLIVQADCHHVGNKNVNMAKEDIDDIKKENRLILDMLTAWPPQPPEKKEDTSWTIVPSYNPPRLSNEGFRIVVKRGESMTELKDK